MIMKYLENRHVILSQNQSDKSLADRTVFVFETIQSSKNEKLMNILQ